MDLTTVVYFLMSACILCVLILAVDCIAKVILIKTLIRENQELRSQANSVARHIMKRGER